MPDERECGEPLNDGTGRVCRKFVHPTLGFHGGGHMFAPPDMTDEQIRAVLMSLITGDGSTSFPASVTPDEQDDL